MKELEVTIQLRNNRLKQRRVDLGLSQDELAKSVGISYTHYNGLETMRMSPVRKKKKDWAPSALKLAEFYGVPPIELFPEAIKVLVQNKVVRRIDVEDIDPLLSDGQRRAALPPETILLEREEIQGRLESISRILEELGDRSRRIMMLRYGLTDGREHTLQDIADVMGLNKERVRQIIARVEVKLRARLYRPDGPRMPWDVHRMKPVEIWHEDLIVAKCECGDMVTPGAWFIVERRRFVGLVRLAYRCDRCDERWDRRLELQLPTYLFPMEK